MKVYSWKTLLVTLVLGVPMLFYAIRNVANREPASLVWLVLVLYVIGKGLIVSFSETAYQEDQKRAALGKKLYREKFGVFAPIMPYLHIPVILLDALMLKLWPTEMTKTLGVVILLATIGYMFWLSHWFTKSMKVALAQEPNDALQA